MTQSLIEKKHLEKRQQQFIELSKQRYERMLQNFSQSQADRVQLIPLLFHVNHPALPGYVDKQTPHGIPNYSKDSKELKLAKALFKSFELQSKALLKFEILGLYLMGSTGTLAQSYNSDLDLWICVEQSLNLVQQEKLIKKADKISAWIAEYGIELNCFIVFSEQFKQQQQQSISKDNSGSMQNFLLLDEFYRTAIWLVGRMPLWWLVPPEANYPQFCQQLVFQKVIEPKDWIDFGDVTEIPAGEYFSAALWQLYKSTTSPYKSAMKLLLLEIYARHVTQAGLLSTQFKQKLYQQGVDANSLDAYYLVLEYAEEYLQDNPQRLEFLRRAFYLKANCKVELDKRDSTNWRYQPILSLVKKWGWNQARLDYLNQRYRWKVKQIIVERADIFRELNHSYHFITNFARIHGVLNEANQNELVSISRMLYASFEKHKGKIDNLNVGIATNLVETNITLHHADAKWLVFCDRVTTKQAGIHQAVYTANSFFKALTWCIANRILSEDTQVNINAKNEVYLQNNLTGLSKHIEHAVCFSMPSIGASAFLEKAKTVAVNVYVNCNQDPLISEQNANYFSVVSNDDGFQWGALKINLYAQLSVLSVNSWGEKIIREYSGEAALIELFKENPVSSHHDINVVEVYGESLRNTEVHRQRLHEIFDLWQDLKVKSQTSEQCVRFLMSVENGILSIDFAKGVISNTYYDTEKDFLNQCAITKAKSLVFYCDNQLSLTSGVQSILTYPADSQPQVFFLTRSSNVIYVFIKDSLGNCFFQAHSNVKTSQLINHYLQFLDSIAPRMSSESDTMHKPALYLWDQKSKENRAILVSEQSMPNYYENVSATARFNSSNEICFDLACGGTIYLYDELSEMVYSEVVKNILKRRKQAADYPIFVTNIDASVLGESSSLMDFLELKREIETKLAQAVSRQKL
ncbi:class I adenylate cyclase [Aliikangiella sp. IMCC44632]